MKESLKRKYFHLKMLIVLITALVNGVWIGLAIALGTFWAYLFFIWLIFMSSSFGIYVLYKIEKKYQDIDIKFFKVLPGVFLLTLFYGSFLLYMSLIKYINIPMELELVLLNVSLVLLVIIGYTTPGAKKSIKRSRLLEGDLNCCINNLKERMGIEDAEVYIFDGTQTKIANALQIGGRGKYIFVSSYLVDNLNFNELLAVIAHELAHIKFKHVLKLIIIIFSILFIGFNMYILLPLFKIDTNTTQLLQIAAIWIPIILINFIIPMIRRKFEKQADIEAAKYVGKEHMISALEKLSDLALIPKNVSKFWNFGHPSIEARINYLKNSKFEKQ